MPLPPIDERRHPAYSTPGKPGDTRYICPFCEWFVDFGDGDVLLGYFRPVLWLGSRAFDRNDFVEKVLEGHISQHAEQMTDTTESGT